MCVPVTQIYAETQCEEIYLRYWNEDRPLPLELFRQELTAFSEGRAILRCAFLRQQ